MGFQENGVIDGAAQASERESSSEEMDCGSRYASSAEFIASLQGQARKLSDKKIN